MLISVEQTTTDVAQYRDKLQALEQAITDDLPSVSCEARHYFAHGTYVRELLIPAGVLLTGKIHRYEGINILSKGHVVIISDHGRQELEAPHTMVCGAGVKKAIVAVEDSVWLNVHPWNGTDTLEEIEAKVIAASYADLDGGEA